MEKKNEKIVITIVVAIAIILLSCGVFCLLRKEEPGATGHFYGKPSSVDNIRSISIVYNEGKDRVFITSDHVSYYTYDQDGNRIDNNIAKDASAIFKYVYENDLKYLTDYDSVKDEKWSLRVDGPGSHCLISSREDEPKWFKDLLEELDVDKNGYLSK